MNFRREKGMKFVMGKERKKKNFIPYIPGGIDKESQFKRKTNEVEEFILKPLYEGIYSLTETEINSYLQIQIEKLKETKLNMKTIIIFEQTKKFIEENKDEILKRINEKQRKEKEGNER